MEDRISAGMTLLPIIKRVCAPFLKPASAEILLLCTAAVESEFVERRQAGVSEGNGAYGKMQQELPSIGDGLLYQNADILSQILTPIELVNWQIMSSTALSQVLQTPQGDIFSVLGARLHYRRAPGQLPEPTDHQELWRYYKTWYNSSAGATTCDDWYDRLSGLVLPVLARAAFA